MGVIICDSPTGSFAVVIIPKCGSTTVRYLLRDVAQPGQYIVLDRARIEVKKVEGWNVASIYRGELRSRSWGVLRNPWRRILSRWCEKGTSSWAKPGRSWADYVNGFIASGVDTHTMLRSQSMILGRSKPKRLVAIESIADWLPQMAETEGVELGDPVRARSQGDYDWKQFYRDKPETRDIVRDLFAPDWDLGIEWDDPLL